MPGLHHWATVAICRTSNNLHLKLELESSLGPHTFLASVIVSFWARKELCLMPHQTSVKEIHFKWLLLVLFKKNDLFLIEYPQGREMSMCFCHANMGRKKKKKKNKRTRERLCQLQCTINRKKMPCCVMQLTKTLSILTEICHLW